MVGLNSPSATRHWPAGLDIIRKTLGKHEIAVVQTTAPDAVAGTVILTTLLAHTSGEWFSSEWPVCQAADIAMPRRMGAALTYARRYSLFTLVGIAGEDYLDVPDLKGSTLPLSDDIRPSPANAVNNNIIGSPPARPRYPDRTVGQHKPVLDAEQSAALRERLMAEVSKLGNKAEALAWAVKILAEKNKLKALDAVAVEQAFRSQLAGSSKSENEGASSETITSKEELSEAGATPNDIPAVPLKVKRRRNTGMGVDKTALAIGEPRRIRDKQHLKFVSNKPCLVCGRAPADAHHLRYTQPSAMGRKVSDEFTVPLCRTHHSELHRHGQEKDWWTANGIDPLSTAANLWQETRPLKSLTSKAQGAES
jgi:hypothetical protein